MPRIDRAIQVRHWLDEIFGTQSLPDFTPLDYFFWGWVKQIVCKKESRTEEEMKQAFNKIKRRAQQDPNLLRRVQKNNHRRLLKVIANGGRHIELRRI